MNAKQAEQVTGISRRNLRFYEQQGLIHPDRNPGNDYRDYSQKDVDTLKLIRALRMLDTPLEDIAAYLHGEMTMEELSKAQEQRLEERQKEVEISISFCRKLQQAPSVDAGYVDALLRQMDEPEVRSGLFTSWVRDYQRVVKAEMEKSFVFTPDDEITNSAQFTDALYQYADDNNLNLVITKEGLEPEFQIDGIEYTARRVYRRMGPVPILMVRCEAQHPELLEADVPGIKGKLMKLFHFWWFPLLTAVIWLPRAIQAEHPGQVVAAGCVLLVASFSMYWEFRNFRG